MKKDDLTIIKAAQRGNEEGWRKLIAQYTRVVWSAAASYSFSLEERKDIVQDVFLKLVNHIGEYDPSCSSLSTYLTVITKRICIDNLRYKSSKPQMTLKPEEWEKIAQKEKTTPNNKKITKINELIDNILNPHQRLVIRMFYSHQLSYRQISEIINKDFNWVKNTLHRARKKLKEAMLSA